MKIIAIEEHFSLDVVERAINCERSSAGSAAARASGPLAAQLRKLGDLGPVRILFSVDYPFSANEEGYPLLDTSPLSPDDIAKIAHGNAERLLNL
jgi:predicted TIM-barrel fold metal-dependent hydrolase